jgi:SAM-dependent methyltransferase
MRLAGLLRGLVPARLRRALAVAIRTRSAARRVRRQPRPDPAAVFGEVYAKGIWGASETAFYSGGGSDEHFAAPYCEAVRAYVDAAEIERPMIVDLGCGDFRVGQRLMTDWAADYVGVDVVPALIEHNQQVHAGQNVRFVCSDVVTDELPAGDVCLVRQVFQHLSNDEILRVLGKLERYPHVIVTEHYPADELTAIPNLDKVPGADTRLSENSGVYIDKPPFSRRIRPLLAVDSNPGEIRTFALVRD